VSDVNKNVLCQRILVKKRIPNVKLQGTPSDGIRSDRHGQREGQTEETRLVVASHRCFVMAPTRNNITTVRMF